MLGVKGLRFGIWDLGAFFLGGRGGVVGGWVRI